jgi:hypothetical protein
VTGTTNGKLRANANSRFNLKGNAEQMSVTTGSFGTADVPASSRSLYGLDGVNFFLAAVLAGFGPYAARGQNETYICLRPFLLS